MAKRKQVVDLTHTIPSDPTDVWMNDATTIYFFDRYHAVDLYQRGAQGQVQHLSLTPQSYINFTCQLKQAGYRNISVAGTV